MNVIWSPKDKYEIGIPEISMKETSVKLVPQTSVLLTSCKVKLYIWCVGTFN